MQIKFITQENNMNIREKKPPEILMLRYKCWRNLKRTVYCNKILVYVE